MSFSDAIGQINQIVQWEQQLADPSTLTGGSGIDSASTTATTSASSASGSTAGATPSADTPTTSFADALAQAQTGAAATTTTDPTAATDTTATTDPAATADSDLLSSDYSQLLAQLSATEADPATAASTVSTQADPATAASTTAAPTTSTQATGSSSGPSGGEATSASDPRVEAMTNEANSLVGKPYVYGGGHDGWGTQSGYDCSGFVSAVLHAGGYLSTPQDTTTMPSASGLQSGPGNYVTVYDRDEPGESGHVIIEIDGQFYESGGESGSWGGGGGVQQIATPPASYLDTFDKVLHPTGL